MNKVNDINIIKEGLREVHILNKWAIPLTILDALFKSLGPFVHIIMSARIINELVDTKNISLLIKLVAITIGLNLFIHLISNGLEQMKTLSISTMWQNQDMRLNEKIISMDYQHVENPEVHLLRAKIVEGERVNSLGVYSLIRNIGELINGLFTVITSIFLMTEFFKIEGNIYGSLRFLGSPIINYLFIAILIFITTMNFKLKELSERRFYNAFEEIIHYNKYFSFYHERTHDYNAGKEIRLYNQKGIYNKEFDKISKGIGGLIQNVISDNYKYAAVNGLVASMISGFVYIFVGIKAIVGLIPIGNVVKYAGSINQFLRGSTIVLGSITELKTNNPYLKYYLDFLAIEGEKYKGTIPVEKRDDDEYELEFRNVSFKYPGSETYALRNVSLKLNIGERLAIVGMNGSGKTTFIKLLCRLYDPDEGEILLNGIDIKKYNYEEYLKLFSIVFQDFKLFSFSLGQNIATSTDYDKELVKEIVVKAGLEDRLKTMERGIETSLYKDFDEKGVEISGGEAQKIALARALYRDAPIIILDEPTAALDPIAEFEIYSKFNEIVGTKTAFYISHRLSSCRFCDEIAVFHEGRIIQKGKHDELLEDIDGKYSELWNSQAQYYNDDTLAV